MARCRLGAAPILNSKMDDIIQPFVGRLDNVRLLPAYSGWNTRQTEALTQGRIVVPGSSGGLHKHLDGLDTRPHDERYDFDWITSSDPRRKRSSNTENMIGLQCRERGYNVIIQPERRQLNTINYWSQTKKPDFIIEGKPFDAIAVRTSNARNIADRITEKLIARQADSIILDITESKVTLEKLAKQFKEYNDGFLYNLGEGLDLEQLWIRNNDQLFPFLIVENQQIKNALAIRQKGE